MLAAILGLLSATQSNFATVRYVDAASASPVPPYTTWATAAQTIQQAVDAAVAGDEILVTNGVYATGGRAVYGTQTNRVAVDRPVFLHSLNGPQATTIQGYQVPGVTNGDAAIRCVYLTNGVALSGFTLTRGATQTNGDLNLLTGGGLWCEATTGTTVSGSVVSNCVITANAALNEGGGVWQGNLFNCTLTGNWSDRGGGAGYGLLQNCIIRGNQATRGGGAADALCANCAISGNQASSDGGGGLFVELYNCTVVGNTAGSFGGGETYSDMVNCIVYFNTAPASPNFEINSSLNHCCTTPQPPEGSGNIVADPLFVDFAGGDFQLQSNSPCINVGLPVEELGRTDLAGNPRISSGAIDIGAYEFQGPVAPSILSQPLNQTVAVGSNATFLVVAAGTEPLSYQWTFQGSPLMGSTTTALILTSVQVGQAGDYSVIITNSSGAITSSVAALTVNVPVTRYVDANSSNPQPPYTSWGTAAATIQDAVDASVAFDEIVVTNGVYATGGRAVYASMTNRVVVDKAVAVRSVNGPEFTTIRGYQVPSVTNGNGAIRCAYLTNGASLSGFTLTNGATLSTTFVVAGGSGGGVWCESTNSVVANCVIAGNAAALVGGGAYSGTLSNCAVMGNWAGELGGGASSNVLDHCTLAGNRANHWGGGGAVNCFLNACMVVSNSAPFFEAAGGGVSSSSVNNSALIGNLAGYYGGGAAGGSLNNCTVVGNSAFELGGVSSWSLTNCIVFFNQARSGDPNYGSAGSLDHCCTTPQPTNGVGNISADPQLASLTHLSAASPCRGAGSAAAASGSDIDDQPWANPPSIGCAEYLPGAVTGPLDVSISVPFTAMVPGFPLDLVALIQGRTTGSFWDFGDGLTATNLPVVTHVWTAPGDYPVVLRAYNESQPAGISATLTVHVGNTVYYVAAGNTSPSPPYTSWATAATNIQDAVDAATVHGALVLVTNGVYGPGVAVAKPLTLSSLNGPAVTIIDGGGTNQCVSLADQSSLIGFTLTNGSGGVSCAAGQTVSNCFIVGNSSIGAIGATLYNCTLSDNSGPGANGGTLYNCALTGNSGFGADGSTLYNCTVTGNIGGGVFGCGCGAWPAAVLYNCIVFFNGGPSSAANYEGFTSLNFCCTAPLPTNGVGNISVDPQLASASHLSLASPCRGAGNPAYSTGTDIDGQPWANPPSIGCDEYVAGTRTGPLTVAIAASATTVFQGDSLALTALIDGRPTVSVWNFADGLSTTNQPHTSHSWVLPVNYPVSLTAYNEAYPAGVTATIVIHVLGRPVHYVDPNNANPAPPYATWSTAANSIQDAVDIASVPGAVILVANGIFASGARLVDGTTNRLVVDKPLTVLSVNGSRFATIDGGGVIRCVYLTNGATLSGFTLAYGFAGDGGGVRCESSSEVVSNCVLTGNTAWSGEGGGAHYGTLNNCVLSDNLALSSGGASSCTLNNCLLTGNSIRMAGNGGGAGNSTLNNCTLVGNVGGASSCALNNCILVSNTSSGLANYNLTCTLNYCCTTPQPTNGLGNITNAPLFVDQAGGDLRLQSNSPCINAGSNSYLTNSVFTISFDLDGNPRIAGGTVDIGAYEFPWPNSIISYAWLQQYGLPTDGSADYADPDGDGLNNWQEWICGTNPTNAASALRIVGAAPAANGVSITWSSVAGVSYFVERSTDLGASRSFLRVASSVPGLNGVTTFTDPGAATNTVLFYRVGVSPP